MPPDPSPAAGPSAGLPDWLAPAEMPPAGLPDWLASATPTVRESAAPPRTAPPGTCLRPRARRRLFAAGAAAFAAAALLAGVAWLRAGKGAAGSGPAAEAEPAGPAPTQEVAGPAGAEAPLPLNRVPAVGRAEVTVARE